MFSSSEALSYDQFEFDEDEDIGDISRNQGVQKSCKEVVHGWANQVRGWMQR